MKAHSKFVVLVALALLILLPACERSASTPPGQVTTPTEANWDDFTVTEDPVAVIATQTAMAEQPVDFLPTDTPEVVVETPTPGEEGQQPQAGTEPTATPAGPLTVLPTPALERPQNYTLRQGEWPICIARRYDLDLGAFFQANGLNMNSKPAAGTTLRIPATGNWNTAQYGPRALRQHPVQHTVTAGQNIYTIACQYGDVSPEAIRAANNLTDDVTVGSTITIP